MKLYRTLSLLAGPFITAYLHKRKAAGKEDPQRMPERLGHAGFPRPEGTLVWVHAASVGESISILPLINRISERFDNIKVLLTTGTTTSAKMMETRLPANAFHQFVPVDSLGAVKRFLAHWKPDIALWVESEFWPNLLMETSKVAPIILMNARVSNTSFSKWQRYKAFIRQILSSFTLCLPQSPEDARRLQVLGAEHVKFIGNLKYDAPALPSDSKKMSQLLGMIEDRHIWVAASTHSGEEEILAGAHQILHETYSDLLTIIIPRHANRGAEIAVMLREKGLKVALRSKEEAIQPETDIYVADTMGELGIFYRLTPIVFIGGSLVPHGGQNPLEAARLECAIIAGNHMDNFLDICRELEDNNAILRVNSKETLAEAVHSMIYDGDKREKLKANATQVAAAKGEILNAYVEEICPYIEKSVVMHKNVA